jgi:Adenylate and Guanylate cyclase catalytic domain
MFTDIAGYTSLTQRDETQALEDLRTHNALLRPIFARFGGTEVKTMGDAFLVEFGSALDATRCAVEMQKTLFRHNAKSKRRLLIRIGIHVGDVVARKGDLFGDAVNIASRIEPLANPGEVCISEQVYDQIRNKLKLPLIKLESRDLKNVTFPIDVYSVKLPWSKRVPAGRDGVGRAMVSVPKIKAPKGGTMERGTINKAIEKIAMKDRIVAVKLTHDSSIPALLARFSEAVDFSRGETLHIVSAVETTTVVLDLKNLDKLTRIIPKKSVRGIYKGLAEIVVSLSPDAIFRPGVVSTISAELAKNGISIFEYFTSTPHAIMIVGETDAIRAYQLMQRLASG